MTPIEPLHVEVRANDTLANERTFLAYIRTALSFIAFGFVIARFSLFAREFAQLIHAPVTEKSVSIVFGTGMALFGVLIALVGAWRHAVTDRGLRRGVVMTLPNSWAYVISIVVTAIGATVAFELLSYR